MDWDSLEIGPCVGIFGTKVQYTTNDGEVFTVTGVFDESYRATDPLPIEGMDPSHVSNTRPCLGVRLADFPEPPGQGDTLMVNGRWYYVQEPQPDGHGGARLLLNDL